MTDRLNETAFTLGCVDTPREAAGVFLLVVGGAIVLATLALMFAEWRDWL